MPRKVKLMVAVAVVAVTTALGSISASAGLLDGDDRIDLPGGIGVDLPGAGGGGGVDLPGGGGVNLPGGSNGGGGVDLPDSGGLLPSDDGGGLVPIPP